MKWKDEVVLKKTKSQYTFCLNKIKKIVGKEDAFICEAVEQGITDEQELIQFVMEQKNVDEILAGLQLAQFVLDYSDYISNEIGHMVIES